MPMFTWIESALSEVPAQRALSQPLRFGSVDPIRIEP